MFLIREALLNFGSDRENIEKLLESENLILDKDLEYTIVVEDNEKIIGTGSFSSNVLKCLAVDKKYQGYGISNKIVSHLIDKLQEKNRRHLFIFTKPIYENQMKDFGFKKLMQVDDKLILLDNNISSINIFIEKILKDIKNKNFDTSNISSIVMNANPFTLGHRYLGELASKNSSLVLVFVVEENKSIFSFDTRFESVKKGFEDIENILVVSGGEYIISSATFPTYFLKDQKIINEVYSKLDALIFSEYLAKQLNIKNRYVGEEPTDIVTRNYNEILKSILKIHNINLIEVERLKNNDDYISASNFRELLKGSNFTYNDEKLLKLLPKTTIDILKAKKEGI